MVARIILRPQCVSIRASIRASICKIMSERDNSGLGIILTYIIRTEYQSDAQPWSHILKPCWYTFSLSANLYAKTMSSFISKFARQTNVFGLGFEFRFRPQCRPRLRCQIRFWISASASASACLRSWFLVPISASASASASALNSILDFGVGLGLGLSFGLLIVLGLGLGSRLK